MPPRAREYDEERARGDVGPDAADGVEARLDVFSRLRYRAVVNPKVAVGKVLGEVLGRDVHLAPHEPLQWPLVDVQLPVEPVHEQPAQKAELAAVRVRMGAAEPCVAHKEHALIVLRDFVQQAARGQILVPCQMFVGKRDEVAHAQRPEREAARHREARVLTVLLGTAQARRGGPPWHRRCCCCCCGS